MKKWVKLSLISCLLFAAFACKSEFEKIRVSNDAALLLSKADEYYEKKEYQKAQTLYELVIPTFRGRKELEQIYYKYAYTYYYLNNYILAAYYFDNFTTTFPTSTLREEVDFMAAYSNYKLSPSYRLDQKYTLTAIEELQTFINTYSYSSRIEEANSLMNELRKKLELKAFEGARLYADMKQYQSAIQSFENVLKDFPETDRAEQIRFEIINAAFLLAENSIIEKQIERYEEALKRTSVFLKRFPKSIHWNEVNVIDKKITQTLSKIKEDDRYKIKSAVY
jgi:outer membrane protein assembly factor BamD